MHNDVSDFMQSLYLFIAKAGQCGIMLKIIFARHHFRHPALKADKRDMLDSNPCHARRVHRSEFSMIFF